MSAYVDKKEQMRRLKIASTVGKHKELATKQAYRREQLGLPAIVSDRIQFKGQNKRIDSVSQLEQPKERVFRLLRQIATPQSALEILGWLEEQNELENFEDQFMLFYRLVAGRRNVKLSEFQRLYKALLSVGLPAVVPEREAIPAYRTPEIPAYLTPLTPALSPSPSPPRRLRPRDIEEKYTQADEFAIKKRPSGQPIFSHNDVLQALRGLKPAEDRQLKPKPIIPLNLREKMLAQITGDDYDTDEKEFTADILQDPSFYYDDAKINYKGDDTLQSIQVRLNKMTLPELKEELDYLNVDHPTKRSKKAYINKIIGALIAQGSGIKGRCQGGKKAVLQYLQQHNPMLERYARHLA